MTAIEWNAARIEALRKHPDQHKYNHGHLLVLSGPRFHTGAARLAARAALRVGAGVVTLGASLDVMAELAPHVTEIMLTEIGGTQKLAAKLGRDQRINALCLGPALGLDERGAELINAALDSMRPCALDADALTLLARHKSLRAKLHSRCVLTPHDGEFARICPGIEIAASPDGRRRAVQAAAEQLGCVVLLKGPTTLVADTECQAVLDSSEMKYAPWLATAGAGDVLAGLVAGLMARGNGPSDAAETGALLHVDAARRCGPGLIAGDLPEMIPQVLRELGV